MIVTGEFVDASAFCAIGVEVVKLSTDGVSLPPESVESVISTGVDDEESIGISVSSVSSA